MLQTFFAFVNLFFIYKKIDNIRVRYSKKVSHLLLKYSLVPSAFRIQSSFLIVETVLKNAKHTDDHKNDNLTFSFLINKLVKVKETPSCVVEIHHSISVQLRRISAHFHHHNSNLQTISNRFSSFTYFLIALWFLHAISFQNLQTTILRLIYCEPLIDWVQVRKENSLQVLKS